MSQIAVTFWYCKTQIIVYFWHRRLNWRSAWKPRDGEQPWTFPQFRNDQDMGQKSSGAACVLLDHRQGRERHGPGGEEAALARAAVLSKARFMRQPISVSLLKSVNHSFVFLSISSINAFLSVLLSDSILILPFVPFWIIGLDTMSRHCGELLGQQSQMPTTFSVRRRSVYSSKIG